MYPGVQPSNPATAREASAVTQIDVAPVESVALLFTDIEGSTARWDADRVAMQSALRRHDAILRAAIEASRGRVFKTVGDSFYAVFDDVGAALAAAIAGQRDLAAENWDSVNGLRVRMAVHVGEAEARDGDYFGPEVNRIARLLAAGHGGQVLVSGFAADAAAANLPAEAGLRSLGTLPLRGLRRPERVFQLTAEGLRSAFRPLRALEPPPNNLPRQLSSFVGRQRDVANVEELLHANSLVTIVGTGGVGKTRLALEAAYDALGDVRDGAWFVDLAPLSDKTLVASAILSALGASQTSGLPAADVLVEYCKSRQLLLVLDNCEHLVDDVARIVSAVVAGCPQAVILATSREPLNVEAERLYRLSSLAAGDAVALFTDRAQAADPAFHLDARNRAGVDDLCRRLDGIALAIELAAARLRSVSLEELSRRLQLRVLSGGPRDRQARQQTMQALIGWSYELLTPGERVLFRDLAAFAGGFTLEAAVRVHAGDAEDHFDVLDTLASLVDKSLLAVESHGASERYRLLEPIREYARERLDESGLTLDALQRHARAYAAIADGAYVEWDASPPPDWLARNADELDNLRVALEFALAERHDLAAGAVIAGSASPLFLRLSLLREGVGWAERGLECSAQVPGATLARLSYGLSMLYHNQGADARALEAAQRAAQWYREISDERGLARALSQVAYELAACERYDEAARVADDALSLSRDQRDACLHAATLLRTAAIFPPKQVESARARFSECVDLFRALKRDDETARALMWWADIESVAGNFARSAEIIAEALPLAPPELKSWFAGELASCYAALGDERAERFAREALELAVRERHPSLVQTALLCVAFAAAERNPERAAELLGYVETRFREVSRSLSGADVEVAQRLRHLLERRLDGDTLQGHKRNGGVLAEDAAVAIAIEL